MPFLVPSHLLGQRWARPHQAHLAPQHVVNLGQLIETSAPQEAAHASDARIVFQLESAPIHLLDLSQCLPLRICSLDHGPELIHREEPASLAHSLLAEEHRAGGIEANGQGNQEHHRQGQDQTQDGDQHIRGSLEGQVEAGDADFPDPDKGNAVDVVHIHSAEAHLEKVWDDARLHVSPLAFVHQADDLAVCLPGQSNDDLVNEFFLQHERKIVHAPQSLETTDVGASPIRVVIHETHYLIPELRMGHQVAHQRTSCLSRADDEHPGHSAALPPQPGQHDGFHQSSHPQEYGDQDSSIEENQAGIDKGTDRKDEEDQGHDPESRAIDDGAHLIEPGARAARVIKPCSSVGEEQQCRQQRSQGDVGAESRIVGRVHSPKPLQFVAHPECYSEGQINQHHVDSRREQGKPAP